MNSLKGAKEFFPGIEHIKFEGKESRNPMAFATIKQIEL